MTPDFSTPDTSEHLNALLGQAGVGSLRALIDLPLAETCSTPGLLSFDAQDWDLVARAAEQSGLIDRLAFGWRDEKPGVGLKEVAPSKRALLCLVGLGIISLAQLYDSRLGTLLSLRRHLGADDIPCLLLRLKEYQIPGHTSGLPNNPDTESPPVSESVPQPVSQINLDDSTARLSIAVLNLSSRTREYLHYSDVHTLRELVDRIPSDAVRFHSQGVHQLWKEVKASLQTYLDANSPGSVQAKEPPPEPNLGKKREVTAEDEAMLRAVSSVSLAAILNHPIDELEISVRPYNCLKRAGVDTIGQLLTVLPRGYSAVRNAGPQTWSEIEYAVDEYLSKHDASLDDLQAEIEPSLPTALASHSHVRKSIETLELPPDIIDALRSRDITTIQTLAVLPLFQLARISELSTLTHEDWFSRMPAIKDCDAPECIRPMFKCAKPRPSLLALNLSARPLNCLVRAGILDLDTLAHCTLVELVNLRNFGAKSIEEVLAKMRAALDSGAITFDVTVSDASRSNIQSEPIAPVPSDTPTLPKETPEARPDEALAPAVLSLDERLNAWFADLNERQRAVIRWRYGLTDGQSLTLDEIGERINLTRERVRQIQAKAIRRLQHPPRLHQVHSLIAQLHHTIVGAGSVMSEAELGSSLTDFVETGEVNLQGAVHLLLDLGSEFVKVKGMQAWCLPELSGLIPLVGSEVIGVLKTALAPIAYSDLLSRFKQTKLYRENHDILTDQFVLACIRADEKIVQREDGTFGLESWDRYWQDDIVLALRHLGEPTHYTAIADAINASLQDGQHVTARAVHIRLMQHPDIFVWVGRRGTYGLKEWGIERAKSYVDALTQILQDSGHPLSITEILAALVKLRPYYDETSVQLTLGTNSQFRAFPGTTFGLAEWREEDFANSNYRVQRLFGTSEVVSVRGTKREVLEAISEADSFIARIRENSDYTR